MDAPVSKLHWEDFAVGSVATCGPRRVTREEIVAFAAEFDPQPFHLDEEAARTSMLGGLCASGWHTCCLMMRLLADGFLNRTTSMGSPGIDEVRWLLPLRPGDSISLRITVADKRASKSRPDRGFVRLVVEVLNQAGGRVMTLATTMMMKRREHGAATAAAPVGGESRA